MKIKRKIVAIDAFNAIYQFLAIIRQPDGTPLQDSMEKITSLLSGLFSAPATLLRWELSQFTFLTNSPYPKSCRNRTRKQIKVEATVNYEKAAQKGDTAKNAQYAQATMTMREYMKTTPKNCWV